MNKYLILLLIAIFSIPFASESFATTSTGSTVKTSIKKKVIIKKPVKKVVKVNPNTVVLNKPFVLGDIEYTILSVQTFDKVGYQNSYSDYHYAKNGTYLMIKVSYKNLNKNDDATLGDMSIISGDRIYSTSSEGQVYGEYQMGWDQSSMGVNIGSYIPPGTRKDIFLSFDVPKDVMEKGDIYIDGGYFTSKKISKKVPLSNLK